MTGKELLESAAKAAGMKFSAYHPDFGVWDDDNGREWNPITDDGDALRLAVRLRLTIQHNFRGVMCYDSPDFCDKSNTNMIEVWENAADQAVATRRAIVRAAAEIGKSSHDQ